MKTFQDLVTDVKPQIKEISPEEVSTKRRGGEKILLIDVREGDEFLKARIPGARLLPRGIIELQIGRIAPDPATPIVCHCGGGGRSAMAAKALQDLGYTNVASMAGGFRDWVAKGLPVRRGAPRRAGAKGGGIGAVNRPVGRGGMQRRKQQ